MLGTAHRSDYRLRARDALDSACPAAWGALDSYRLSIVSRTVLDEEEVFWASWRQVLLPIRERGRITAMSDPVGQQEAQSTALTRGELDAEV